MTGVLMVQRRCWHLVGSVKVVALGDFTIFFKIATVPENQNLSSILVLLLIDTVGTQVSQVEVCTHAQHEEEEQC